MLQIKNVRDKYFTCSSLKELFENVDATTIIDFIKEINFYHLLWCLLFSSCFILAVRALFLLKLFYSLFMYNCYRILIFFSKNFMKMSNLKT